MIFTPTDRAELIKKLKAEHNSAESILTLLCALPSMRLVLSWPLIPISVPDTDVEVRDSATDSEKLWEGVTVDFEAAALASRIPQCMIEMHVREAQLHFWIFPDGTYSEIAGKTAKSSIVAHKQRLNRKPESKGDKDAGNGKRGQGLRDQSTTPAA